MEFPCTLIPLPFTSIEFNTQRSPVIDEIGRSAGSYLNSYKISKIKSQPKKSRHILNESRGKYEGKELKNFAWFICYANKMK